MRVLSGIQPSGGLHLGNYVGMMKRMIQYQEKHDLYCFIVNYHALTSQQDPKLLRELTHEAVADFLALGLDPERSVFWVQSDVPEVTELTWVLSNVTSMGLLERCHSYKDKIASGLLPNHGLFAYPVLMTADILIMHGELVPIGEDQKQHLEVARDIAQRFNRIYGPVFTVPEPEIQKGTGMLPGIDGRKMSKAYKNTIPIFSSKEELKKCVMAIQTDSTPVDQPKPTKNNVLFTLYAELLDDAGRKELKKRFETPGEGYGTFKKELLELIWKTFEPYRARREEFLGSRDKMNRILNKGAEKARETALKTMKEVRKAIGIDYHLT